MIVAGDPQTSRIVSVVIRGESPNESYIVRLQIRNQGFDIGPGYDETDEDGPPSAEWMASMLRKALRTFVTDLVMAEPKLTPAKIPTHLAVADRGVLVCETIAAAQRRILERLEMRLSNGQENGAEAEQGSVGDTG